MSASQLLQAALDRNSGDHYVSIQLDAARKDSILDSRNWMLDEHQASSIEHRKIGKTPGLASDVTMKAAQTILTGPDADTVNEDGKAPVCQVGSVNGVCQACIYLYRASQFINGLPC